jgi:hypothetical protein
LRARAIAELKRARALPVGPGRNELRQIAIGLLELSRRLPQGAGPAQADDVKAAHEVDGETRGPVSPDAPTPED